MLEKKVKNELIACLGKDNVRVDGEYLLSYSYDASDTRGEPGVVVFPRCEQDIEGVLKIASRHRVPVVPRGAGVGYTGGSVPINGGIAMVFTKMNRILSIDTDNLLAEVEPGVVTHHLQQAVEARGLFYPPDPASLKTSTIGGNVAENSGGLRCFKYGVTGNYVMALDAYLVSGERIHAGSHVIKDVAGYDLKSLLVGSEGTLAVISKITLRLIPLPKYRRMFRVDFVSLQSGAEFINRVIRANIAPSLLEFMDKTSITAVYGYMGLPLDERIGAAVLIEIDGNQTDVEERKDRFLELVKGAATGEVLDYRAAESEKEIEELWNARRNISPAIARRKPKKINEDIVVPIARIPETVTFINNLAAELELDIPMFGHFGDGNIHTNIMVDPGDGEEMKRAEIALDKILRHVVSVKGSITGEHGVGTTKKPFMKYQFSDREMTLFKNIKKAFDPENLLNPGKIF